MSLCARSCGLFLSPASSNWLVAGALPLVVSVCLLVPWDELPLTLFVVDHAIAFKILAPILLPLAEANLNPTDKVDVDVAVLRATSGGILATASVHLTAYLLGRTVLLTILVFFFCGKLHAKCWGVSLAATLQLREALSFLPAGQQHVLRGSLLDLLDGLLDPTQPHYNVLSLVRALVPLFILGPESREDALRLLPPEVVEGLRKPIVDHLPRKYHEVIAEPWSESERLRLRRGRAPPEDEASTPASAAAARADEDEDGEDGEEGYDMMRELPARSSMTFLEAAAAAKRIPEGKLTTAQMLELYGLYKRAGGHQASETPQPSRMAVQARAKWDAWDAVRELSPDEARARYCRLVELSSSSGVATAPGSAPSPAAAPSSAPNGRTAAAAPAAASSAAETIGSSWAVLAPEVLMLKVAARRLVRVATEKTTTGWLLAKAVSLPCTAVSYVLPARFAMAAAA